MKILWLALAIAVTASANHQVQSLKVKILSTMLADGEGYGEWGFAALVEVDGRKILFDTGAHPNTVLNNLPELKVDLSDVEEVILSHHHYDHTAGLVRLREEMAKKNPKALQIAHIGQGAFIPRNDIEGKRMLYIKRGFEQAGGKFIEYTEPKEIHPGVWLTGLIPRKYPERNWSGSRKLVMLDGTTPEDNLPEDMTLVIETSKGLVVIAGCSHAGIINILDHARTKIRKDAPIHAAIGGLHLFNASDETLRWTAGKFREFGLQNLLGAHCTGIEAVYKLRELTGLSRKTAAVGALGGGFDLATGLDPGTIAR
jgi:7,8-dihydropterin-6-yl-methyl-4-(beta-D-ribofuranosyl)aminobenzene 5'-phosphate synthase